MSKEIVFAGKLIRLTDDGKVQAQRLMNARTGEKKWFEISHPTAKLLKALDRAPQTSD